jgi:hypothetical protein
MTRGSELRNQYLFNEVEKELRAGGLYSSLENYIGKLKQDRRSWEVMWNNVQRSVDPNWKAKCEARRNNFTALVSSDFPREPEHECRGTSLSLVRVAIHQFISRTLSPDVDWLSLEIAKLPDGRDLSDNEAVERFLVNLSNKVSDIANTRETNFYCSSNQIIASAFMVGTGIRYITYPTYESVGLSAYGDNSTLKFSAVDPRTLVYDTDGYENIVFVARELYLTVAQSYSIWGEAVFSAGEMASTKGPYELASELRKYIHIVRLNNYRNGPKDKAVYQELVLDEKAKRLVAIGTLEQMPYIIWRYFREWNDKYGTSSLIDMYRDIVLIDKYENDMHRSAHSIANPTILLDNGIRAESASRVVKPNSFVENAFDVRTGRERYKKFTLGEGFPVAAEMFRQSRVGIAEGLIIRDVVQQNNQAGLTSTLVEEQALAKDERIKPIMIQWETEELERTIRHIIFSIDIDFPYQEARILESELPEPIKMLSIRFGGEFVEQRRLHQDRKLNKIIQETQQIATIWPEVLDELDPVKIMKAKAKINGLKYDVYSTESRKKETRLTRARAQERQQIRQSGLDTADIAGALAKGGARTNGLE